LFLVHHNLTSETNPLSTSRITISSTVNENENKNYSQPFQETNVTVDLFDCMKCYIRIPRCQVKIEEHFNRYLFPSRNDILLG